MVATQEKGGETGTVAAGEPSPSVGQSPATELLRIALERFRARGDAEPRLLAAIDPGALASPADAMNLGVLWRAGHRPRNALTCYRLAQAAGLDTSDLWTNLGNVLKDLRRDAEACVAHARAVGLAPRSALAWHNYGIALQAAGRTEEAVEALTRAVALEPGDARRAEWDLSRALLMLGRHREGWAHYRARWGLPGHVNPHDGLPEWRGEPLAGRHLLLWGEQGFGDVIQCLRFLRLLRARAGDGPITVRVAPPLLPLVRASFTDFDIRGTDEPVAAVDCQASLLDLPGLFVEEQENIPFNAGYLNCPIDFNPFEELRRKLPARLHVGIVWSGSVTFRENAERAIPVARLLEHVALPGVALYSLQIGPPAAELAALPGRGGVLDLAPLIKDFSHTAQAVAAMDLVIMTDSSVVHLCGALGREVWVLLARRAHWLWQREREDSPWYRSMRLFRQRSAGEWREPLDRVAACLQERLFA